MIVRERSDCAALLEHDSDHVFPVQPSRTQALAQKVNDQAFRPLLRGNLSASFIHNYRHALWRYIVVKLDAGEIAELVVTWIMLD